MITAIPDQSVSVRAIDWKSEHVVRTPWITCPRCDAVHPTEFIWSGEHWIGFCHVTNRPLEATFQESES